MSINDNLADWLLSNKRFMAMMSSVMVDSITPELGSNFTQAPRNSEIIFDSGYASYCASILAHSSNSKSHDYALRIAQFLLTNKASTKTQKDAGAMIMKYLSNSPGIELAEKRKLIEEGLETKLSLPARLDWMSKTIEHEIMLANGNVLYANKFQNELWDSADSYDITSISAPTSAGKSFILKRWIVDDIKSSLTTPNTIVYIVPTRALIAEIEKDFKELLSGLGKQVNVSSSPLPSSLGDKKVNILIFTQERFQIFLNHKKTKYDLNMVVVDEAHKMGDNYRGVLLQQVLEDVVDKHPDAKVVFLSPLTKNPEILLADFKAKRTTHVINSKENQVNQNLIWCSSQKGKPKLLTLEVCTDNGRIPLGQLELEAKPTPATKKLPLIAYTIGKHSSGNIIYVDGAALAEKRASQLFEFLGESFDISAQPEIRDLVSLTKDHIHKDYYLAKTITRGVAFHYGNMPDIIRSEIERLFSNNTIKFLICTSTLVEGVNTSCKNIFLQNPKKGKGTPMNGDDFWNLAGRAGRWGKEFQGNIFCIDPTEWDAPAPERRSEFEIIRSTDSVLSSVEKFLIYIRSSHTLEIERSFEFVFSYLFSQFNRYGSLKNTPWASRFDAADLALIDVELATVSNANSLPMELFLRNPGISPIYINSMLDKMKNWITSQEKSYGDLIPPEPDDAGAINYYASLFLDLDQVFLTGELGTVQPHAMGNAIVVVNWMRGFPLSRIISSRVKYEKKKIEGTELNQLIRQVMEKVESIARFYAPKYLACYIDILRYFLAEESQHEYIATLSDYDLLLEYGVSSQTQIALVALGLSRATALNISEFIKDDTYFEAQALKWIKEKSFLSLPISPVMKRELLSLLDFIGD